MTEPDPLLAFVRAALDPAAEPTAVHATLASGRVLRAATRHGPVIAKLHRSPQRHHQELHAYRHWTAVLRDAAPRLLAARAEPPMVIVTALPGRPAALQNLAPAQQRDLHAQAGALLRTFHTAAPPYPDTDIAAWLSERGERRLTAAAAVLTTARRREIRAHLRALTDLGPLPTVPCHLDFTPRNLLRDHHGTIRVIDFEHSRHDLAARDLVRLADRIWIHRPDLQAAFLDSYGPLTDLDRAIIEHATHLDHLTAAAPLAAIEQCGHAPQPSPWQAAAANAPPASNTPPEAGQ